MGRAPGRPRECAQAARAHARRRAERAQHQPEDAQLLASRRFQVEDIARAFGVPPFMIGATEKTTSWGSGVEHGHGLYSLHAHARRAPIEQEINRKCFRTATYFAEFLLDALQRGDLKARGDYYRQARGGSQGPGWMTANEIRALENSSLTTTPQSDKIYQRAAAASDPAPGKIPARWRRRRSGDGGRGRRSARAAARPAAGEKNPYAPQTTGGTMRTKDDCCSSSETTRRRARALTVKAEGDEALIYLYDIIDPWWGVVGERLCRRR
jgi:hypothetical protein